MILFADNDVRRSLGSLANQPFNRWSKVYKAINSHSSKDYHKNSYTAGKSFLKTIEEPKLKITNMMSNQRLTNIQQNRNLLIHIVRAVVYLSKQGLAFRGDDEFKTSKNRGNFLEFLRVLAIYILELKAHLDRQSSYVSYISPMSQNEFISVIGQEIIRQPIKEEINKSTILLNSL